MCNHPAKLADWEDIRNAGHTGHEQLPQWGHPFTQFITLSSKMTNGGANRCQGFVYSVSQGALRPGTLVALMFPPFVPLSSHGWPPEWSLYFIYLLGWKKNSISVRIRVPHFPLGSTQLADWGPPVMHKSVFIILAWGTPFHQVHDSTEERRLPQLGYISSNQTFQGEKMSGCHQIPEPRCQTLCKKKEWWTNTGRQDKFNDVCSGAEIGKLTEKSSLFAGI